MRILARIAFVTVIALAVATLLIPAPASVAAPNPDTKTVVLACKPGWRGSAVGQYGGVSFGVSCNNGRGNEKLTGVSGSAYSVRMGSESKTGALDCYFTGDAALVNESCGEVRLTIR